MTDGILAFVYWCVVKCGRENFVTPWRRLLPSMKDYEKLVWLCDRIKSLPVALISDPF
jgi:hypothetical protein